MQPLKQFYGDAEYPLALTPALVIELERLAGSGIGAITQRVFNRSFAYGEVVETIRIALIGGGMTAERAKQVTDTYAPIIPLVESMNVAVAVLERLWLGCAPASGAGELKSETVSEIVPEPITAAITGDMSAAINQARNG